MLGLDQKGREFVATKGFALYMLLMAIQIAAWPLAVFVTKRIARAPGSNTFEYGCVWAMLFALMLAPMSYGMLWHEGLGLTYSGVKIGAVWVVGAGVGSFVMANIDLMRFEAQALESRLRPGSISWDDIKNLERLRSDVRHLLFIAGVILSLSVLPTASLFQVVKATSADLAGQKWEFQNVVAFGLFNSMLLALSYARTAWQIRAAGEALWNAWLPSTAGEESSQLSKPELASYKEAGELRERLGLDSAFTEPLRIAAPVLGPLLTALLGVIGLKASS